MGPGAQYYPSPEALQRPPTPPPDESSMGQWNGPNGPWARDAYGGAPDLLGADVADEFEDERDGAGWSVVTSAEDPPRRVSASGSLSSFRQHAPMVPLDEINRMDVPQYFGALPPVAGSRRRRVVRRMNTAMFNLLVITLVLGILGIPVVIGLHHLQATQPTLLQGTPNAATPVATPALQPGFSGFQNALFSIAYPSGWRHATATKALADGTVARIEDFTGQSNQEMIVGTAAAVPSDELQRLVDAAAQLNTQQAVLQPLAAGTRKTYDKQQWIENDYTFTRVQGNTTTQIEIRVLAVDVGATTYFVVAYGPLNGFATANGAYIEPMLNSFRFQ